MIKIISFIKTDANIKFVSKTLLIINCWNKNSINKMCIKVDVIGYQI